MLSMEEENFGAIPKVGGNTPLRRKKEKSQYSLRIQHTKEKKKRKGKKKKKKPRKTL